MFRQESLSDVLVVPYAIFRVKGSTTVNHVGGPLWPDWEDVSPHRFFREDQAMDAMPAAGDEPPDFVAGDHHWWIGPLDPHFGHFIAEIASRIPPTLALDPDAVLVFAANEAQEPPVVDLPAWAMQILDWFGVSRDRVHVIRRPTVFSRLHVVPQQERLGVTPAAGPRDAYLDLLTENARRNLGIPTRKGTLYVSRAGQKLRIAGEAAVESAFRASGATILRPETLPLHKQLEAYATHETLVFSEGSAMHGLQLLGRDLGHVIVLVRRPGNRLMSPHLPPRTTATTWVDAVKGVVEGLGPGYSLKLYLSLPIADADKLLGALAAEGVDLRPHWSPAAFERAESVDTAAWARGIGTDLARNSLRSLQRVVRGLAGCGVAGARAEGLRLAVRLAPHFVARRLRRGVHSIALRAAPRSRSRPAGASAPDRAGGRT